ncbi:uncharacterized protein MYCFIDRAFT_180068 [Pseudocercospora fijiensis CIRAD86]|uniref:Uncharacterized protein n=1 Tax=Pseudocercospora fijiensis (strain CIRAD86) TaxID=383855 RepID=M2ZYJ8_PSEFD|nr:uncharacterized protein MYCFIDRAFT_180068 [Pseudocercospora fijiensis CIRAD86]EME77191.1 hypothetical protein MYCFIDRAFT_180068 [Pseudocercospora fijiensis CIRAD86]
MLHHKSDACLATIQCNAASRAIKVGTPQHQQALLERHSCSKRCRDHPFEDLRACLGEESIAADHVDPTYFQWLFTNHTSSTDELGVQGQFKTVPLTTTNERPCKIIRLRISTLQSARLNGHHFCVRLWQHQADEYGKPFNYIDCLEQGLFTTGYGATFVGERFLQHLTVTWPTMAASGCSSQHDVQDRQIQVDFLCGPSAWLD